MAVNPAAAGQTTFPKPEESKQTGQLGQRTVARLSQSPIGPRSLVVANTQNIQPVTKQGIRESVGTGAREPSLSVVSTGGFGGTLVFPRQASPAGGFAGLRPSFMGSLSAGSSPIPIPQKGNAATPLREPVGKRLPLERQTSDPKHGSAPSKVTFEMGTQTEENN